jgi:hypothetical protein
LGWGKRNLRPFSKKVILNTINEAFQNDRDINYVIQRVNNARSLRRLEVEYALKLIRKYVLKIEKEAFNSNRNPIIKAIEKFFKI